MGSLYFDTSVILACYAPEARSLDAQHCLEACDDIVISQLTETEFCSALSRKVRMGELPREDAQFLIHSFHVHKDDGLFHFAPITSTIFTTASRWLAECSTPLRTLDALHLAIAQAANVPILTADKPFIQSAQQLGIPVEPF